jgi:hypothetical protein
MKAIYKAIYSRFNTTNDLKTALSGRMYPHGATQNVDFPYCAYYAISEFMDQDFTDERETVNVQFSLFSEEESLEEITTLYEYLKALYDDQILSVDGYTMLEFKRYAGHLIKDIELGVWQYNIDYDVMLEKQKA